MERAPQKAAAVRPLTTTWTLTKRMEKKLDSNYTRMPRAILNKSWREHPRKQQLYGHLPPITKTIKIRRTRRAGHSWRSGDELISDVLLWTPTHGKAKAGRPARTYTQLLCADTECSPEDQPETMDDREGWRERIREVRADGATWRWWWLVSISHVLNEFVIYHSIFFFFNSSYSDQEIVCCIQTQFYHL